MSKYNWWNKKTQHILQQFVVRCQRRLAQEAAGSSHCSSACCDRSQKIRSHLTGAAWTSLASCPSSNRVQVGDDRLQVPIHGMADVGWPTTACLSQLRRADGTWLSAVSLFQEPERYSAHATLRCWSSCVEQFSSNSTYSICCGFVVPQAVQQIHNKSTVYSNVVQQIESLQQVRKSTTIE